MPTWRVKFDGGFAWMFDGNKSVTVAIPKKTVSSSSVAHEKMLIVPDPSRIDGELTTLPGRPRKEAFEFVLRGEVDIKVDSKDEKDTQIRRNLSNVEPPAGVIDDFFFVYSIPRLAKKSGAPKPKATWKDSTLTRLKLDGGTLTVLEPLVSFDIKDGNTSAVTTRELASSILYQSDTSVVASLVFQTRDGDVALKAAGQDLGVIIEANCTCANELPKPGKKLEGFDLIFALYPPMAKDFELTPFVPPTGLSTRPATSPVDFSPGPDCPPSDHSI